MMKRKVFDVFPQSWVGLDITKCVCIVGMVLLHSVVWLISRNDVTIETDNFLFPLLPWIFTIIGPLPLLIPATAGCMMFVYFHPYLKKGEKYPLVNALLYGCGLIFFGYFLNVLAWGVGDLWAWDVLHFLGVSFVLVVIVIKATSFIGLYTLGGVSLVFTHFARDKFSGIPYLSPILVGDSSGMFFWPLFPWFSLVVLGFGMAAYFFSTYSAKVSPVVLLIIGIILVINPLVTGNVPLEIDEGNIWGSSVFQPSISVMSGFLGLFIIFIILTELLGRKVRLRPFGFVNSLSKGVFWVYALHLIIGFRLSHLFVEWLSLEHALILFPLALLLFSWIVGVAAVWIGRKKFIVEVKKQL